MECLSEVHNRCTGHVLNPFLLCTADIRIRWPPSPSHYTLPSLIQRLDQLLSFELFQCFLRDAYRGSLSELNSKLGSTLERQNLLHHVQEYYHSERLYSLRCLKHLLGYWQDPNHPYRVHPTLFQFCFYSVLISIASSLTFGLVSFQYRYILLPMHTWSDSNTNVDSFPYWSSITPILIWSHSCVMCNTAASRLRWFWKSLMPCVYSHSCPGSICIMS